MWIFLSWLFNPRHHSDMLRAEFVLNHIWDAGVTLSGEDCRLIKIMYVKWAWRNPKKSWREFPLPWGGRIGWRD